MSVNLPCKFAASCKWVGQICIHAKEDRRKTYLEIFVGELGGNLGFVGGYFAKVGIPVKVNELNLLLV